MEKKQKNENYIPPKMITIEKRKYNSLHKRIKYLITKLGGKTEALWFASQIIQSELQKDKSVDEVYEMLKFVGKNTYNQKQAEQINKQIDNLGD